MKNRIWVFVYCMIFLASCQSSRFMVDDMYFTNIDAKREVREYELNKNLSSNLNNLDEVKTDSKLINDEITNTYTDKDFRFENYYDYTYSSRLKRFHTPNNTWAYYDPYYTNYYWYNNSSSNYFGNSVYSTYSWWNPHSLYSYDGWNNNNSSRVNGIYNYNMYYNSYDNNCYWGVWRTEDINVLSTNCLSNFVQLMQSNGISRDVTERPNINYTAIRNANNSTNVTNNSSNRNSEMLDTNILESNLSPTDISNSNNNNTIIVTNNNADNNDNIKTTNSNTVNTNKSNNANNNTAKRWDNHNADVNISPNNNNNYNSNWSRSGVFSEGSRNNNYQYKGSAITNKTDNKATNTKPNNTRKDKNPK